MSSYDDDYTPTVTGHETEHGFAFTVEVRPPNPDDITEALVRRMIADYTVGDKLRQQVSDRFRELIRDETVATIKAIVEEQMLLPRIPTDKFGTPIAGAEPVTFVQFIGEIVAGWQLEKVDPHTGKTASKSDYGWDSKPTRAKWLLAQIAGPFLEKEAKAVVDQMQKEAKATVAERVKAAVAAAIVSLSK